MDGVDFDKPVTGKPSLEIDVERFEYLLDDPELTRAQKHQILEALWTIIVAFVDLGFGVHPAQLAKPCGKDGFPLIGTPQDSADPVYSEAHLESIADKSADGDDPPAQKEDSDDRD